MKINTQDSIQLYGLLQKGGENALQQLTQQERQVVLIALKNIVKSNEGSSAENAVDCQEIKAKLETPDRSEGPSWLARFADGFLAFFHLRIGTHQILNEVKKISSEKESLIQVRSKIKNLENQSADWKEMLRFNEEEALPQYKKMVEFYKTLSPNIEVSRPLIAAQLVKLEEEIKHYKETTNEKGGLLIILEKEYLSSLKKMNKYQGDNFTLELERTIQAFSNAIQFAQDENNVDLAKKDMTRIETELVELRKKEAKMQGSLIDQLSVNVPA